MSLDKLYSFVYRAILTEESLDKTGRGDRSLFSEEWESATSERLGVALLDEELVKKARRMSVVYTAICAFENTVREFISKKLFEEKGESWWDTCVKADIKSKAESRRDSENENRWLTQRGKTAIYYTDFGDLIAIMSKPGNWDFFEPHIIKIDWAKQIIETLEKSRNIIMHGGELSPRDVERVGTYIRDWMSQLG